MNGTPDGVNFDGNTPEGGSQQAAVGQQANQQYVGQNGQQANQQYAGQYGQQANQQYA